MKRIPVLLLLAFFLTAGLAGCKADDEKIVIMEDLNNPSREKIRAKTQTDPNARHILSVQPGIGDVRQHFDNAYGENIADQEISRYMGEFMIVTFEAHRAVNVQYQFAYHPGGELSDKEIFAYLDERIPQDSIKVKEVNDGNLDQRIIQYRSNSLARSVAKVSFRRDEPGTFTVSIFKNERGKVTATVSLGQAR
ncbi:hypothetical protein [Bacillus sp. FJAT-27251]|uniref:hypothetical protein n=1 Tax=Bacillus sp. FJAT-27251 TaxID=1684142 RepID=UPI0006A75F98|nr:hypothetical protein [Bacillus sp. FJAT-27251]